MRFRFPGLSLREGLGLNLEVEIDAGVEQGSEILGNV